MSNTLSVHKRFWLLIIATIIIPNVVEESIMQFFHLKFDHVIWYEVLDTAIMLVFAIPLFLYFIRKSDRYAIELECQISENKKIITEIEQKNKELAYSAYTDDLTELPNRACLFNTLDHLVLPSGKQKAGIFFIDLDRFKIINDTMGHVYGDLFIKEVSSRLRNHLPEENLLFRHGGDEFVIVAPHSDCATFEKLANEVVNLFEESITINGAELFTTVSIGMSVFPSHGRDAETLLKHADKAMYSAKDRGGNTYCIYSLLEEDDDIRQMRLENGLRTALENNQLHLHYQPIINLQTDKVAGVEALIRWEHPELGSISPAEFIPLAEKNGTIVTIGKWVLENACQQVKEWQENGFPDLSVAVNVSIRQIDEKGFPEMVKTVLSNTGMKPCNLTLEITESLMQNHAETGQIFKRLKEIGVLISIDDFGTGYSSLSVLSYLQIDRLKIDQSFTQDMLTHAKTDSIVKTIIDMGNNLELELIAEGIEYKEQKDALRQYGCQYGQGYHLSRPLPAEQIIDFFLKTIK